MKLRQEEIQQKMMNRSMKTVQLETRSMRTNIQRHVSKRKNRPKLSSLKGLLLLFIILALSLMIFLTTFVVQRELSTSLASDETWSLPIDKPVAENTLLVTTRSSNALISPSASEIPIPYYLKGKTEYKKKKFHHKKTFQRIKEEQAKPVDPTQKVWVLPDPVKLPTRNHESILLEYEGGDKQILVNVLGRYSRGVQWMDLNTGEQFSLVTNGTDPDMKPLNDLNHVASVLVDSIDDSNNARVRKEVWLPCGFHSDKVGKEISSNYARIVDLETNKLLQDIKAISCMLLLVCCSSLQIYGFERRYW